MAANVLIVNNYRDMDDDKVVCKNTTTIHLCQAFFSQINSNS